MDLLMDFSSSEDDDSSTFDITNIFHKAQKEFMSIPSIRENFPTFLLAFALF